MPFSCGVLQGGAELLAQFDHFLPGHAAAPAHHLIERFAVDKLHGEITHALILAGAVEADDVGMIHLLENGDLTLETIEGDGIGRADAGGHDLDGHELSALGVAAAINGPHGAGTEFHVDREWTELLSDQHNPSGENR